MMIDMSNVPPHLVGKSVRPAELSVRRGQRGDGLSFQDALAGASRGSDLEFAPEPRETRRTVYDGVGDTAEEKQASLHWAAEQLESFLVNQLLQVMRSTVMDGGLIQKSRAEKMYQQMLDQEMARSISESSPLGIADVIVQQLEDRI